MLFSVEHRFPASPASVAAVLRDPDFYLALDLPDLRLLDVRRFGPSDPADVPSVGAPEGVQPETRVVLHYEFAGDLDPMARRLLGGTRLTWVQEMHLRGDEGGLLTFAAEANPRLLRGRADFALEGDGNGTTRRFDGQLEVAVPVVGGVAERRIVSGVLRRMEVEADAVRSRLAST